MIKLGGIPLPSPSEFVIERYNLTKSGRVASGRMTMDLVAKKRKFRFKYNALDGDELSRVLQAVDSEQMFQTLEYPDVNGTIKTATVYSGSIEHKLAIRNANGKEIWLDVQFDLIEQ